MQGSAGGYNVVHCRGLRDSARKEIGTQCRVGDLNTMHGGGLGHSVKQGIGTQCKDLDKTPCRAG